MKIRPAWYDQEKAFGLRGDTARAWSQVRSDSIVGEYYAMEAVEGVVLAQYFRIYHF